MNEPSVLDYLLSKLVFWRREKIEIPPEPQVESSESGSASETPEITAISGTAATDSSPFQADEINARDQIQPPLEVLDSTIPIPSTKIIVEEPREEIISRQGTWLPWLVFGSLLAALIAQFLFERPERQVTPGVYFYGIAALLTIWAYFRKDLLPPDYPPEFKNAFSLKIRRDGAIVLIPACLVAVVAFGGNKFTVTNVFIWVLALVYLLRMFYLPGKISFSQKIADWIDRLKRSDWTFQFKPQYLFLLIISISIVLFFRLYQLEQLPPEMISDHAEKLLDVFDVQDGRTSIFFPRNTGREAFQFYLTALVADLFGTGLTFLSLKIGTTICGLVTVFYLYHLGKEAGNRWVGLFAALLAGIGYWPNIISRIGLRYPLYPVFVAPTLFYLLRGLRTNNRNDFIWAGISLGIGLHGYTAIRMLPVLVVIAIVLFILHSQSKGRRIQALAGLGITTLTSIVLFLPLIRYAIDEPEMFLYRVMTRVGDLERPLPGSPIEIFFNNVWRAITMFFWSDGDVWVHSIPYRPALDLISAALLFVGIVLLIVRYIRFQHYRDIFWIISIPVLLMPSILSLAFPNENPNLNRTAGAYVPVFIICGIALDAILRGLYLNMRGKTGKIVAGLVGGILILLAGFQNYTLVFDQYHQNYLRSSWNTSEMGSVIRGFVQSVGSPENAWVIPYPHWVDTRLVGINAGYPTRDTAVSVENIGETQNNPGAKLFMLHREDKVGLEKLRDIYPEGRLKEYRSRVDTKNFYIYFVPAIEDEIFE